MAGTQKEAFNFSNCGFTIYSDLKKIQKWLDKMEMNIIYENKDYC